MRCSIFTVGIFIHRLVLFKIPVIISYLGDLLLDVVSLSLIEFFRSHLLQLECHDKKSLLFQVIIYPVSVLVDITLSKGKIIKLMTFHDTLTHIIDYTTNKLFLNFFFLCTHINSYYSYITSHPQKPHWMPIIKTSHNILLQEIP